MNSDAQLKEVYKTINTLIKDIVIKAASTSTSETTEIASSHANDEKRLRIAKLSSTIAERFQDLEQGLLAHHVYTEEECRLEIRELEDELDAKRELQRKIEQCSKRWSDLLEDKAE